MAARLGQVLSWIADILALIPLGFAVWVFSDPVASGFGGNAPGPALFLVGLAVVIYAIGRGLRYILAGY